MVDFCRAGHILGLRLLCSKFYLLFLPAFPKKFTHNSYFMLLSLPIILIKFFWLYCMQELSVAGAALKRSIYSNKTVSIITDCSIRVYRSFWQSTANSSALSHTRTKSLLSNLTAFKISCPKTT